MSSFVANQTEVNKVKSELNQTESLVKDSEDDDELKTKDSLLTVKDDEKTADNSSESIGGIEAELVAELERLQIDIDSSNTETQPSDAFEVSFLNTFGHKIKRDRQVQFGNCFLNYCRWSRNLK